MAGDKTVTFVDVIVTVDHLPMFSRRQWEHAPKGDAYPAAVSGLIRSRRVSRKNPTAA